MPPPPQTIPSDLLAQYTLDGQIPVESWYFDESNQHTGIEWTDELVTMFIKEFSLERIQEDQLSFEFYRGAARFHLEAFQKLPDSVRGKDVAVIGSLNPWIEAICIQFGAASITTVEYNVPNPTSQIQTMSYTEFETVENRFDTIISYSSIEHSGLGRYGDPLNPEADLITMKHCHKALKENGMMFLGVPIGKDTLVWNAHRVYGPLRLCLLLEGFEELFWVGASKGRVFKLDHQDHKQPVIALRKREGAEIPEQRSSS